MAAAVRRLEQWFGKLARRRTLAMGALAVMMAAGYREMEHVPTLFGRWSSLVAPRKAVAVLPPAETRRVSTPPPIPAPDPTAYINSMVSDPLARDALRHVLEADDAARQLSLPDWPEVSEDVPARGGPRLRSKAWYVVDSDTGEVLLSHHADRPYPIASISKLMGMLIYADTQPDLEEGITLQEEDKNYIQVTRSRLRVGARYRAGDLLYHALLPSDNRATIALMHQTGIPLPVFRDAMNRRAELLHLEHAHFEEPTGLDAGNVASARDVARLLEAALANPLVSRVMSEKEHYYWRDDRHILLGARSSNRLSHNETWDVLASKTGYTLPAGSCLAMKSQMADGRLVDVVILGAPGEKGRYPEAEAIRAWIEGRSSIAVSPESPDPDPSEGD